MVKKKTTSKKSKVKDYFKSFNLKGPDEISPNQMKRYLRYYKNNPDGTLIAAGGHKKDILPKEIYLTNDYGNIIYRDGKGVKDIEAMNEQVYRYAWSQLGLKVAVGAMTKEQARKEFEMLKTHKAGVKALHELPPTSPTVDWMRIGVENQTMMLKRHGYLMNRSELLNIIYYHT